MYVQITKAAKPSYWYADRVGDVFKVRKEDDKYIVEPEGGDFVIGCIDTEDCVILREVKRRAKMGEWVKCVLAPFADEQDKLNKVFKVKKLDGTLVRVDGEFNDGSNLLFAERHYVVLEPVKENPRYAVITNNGQCYSLYKDFAIKHGYPNAAPRYGNVGLENGEVVKLLTSGKHECEGCILWIVETENKGQFIVGEDGLEFIDDPAIKDAQLPQLEKEVDNLRDALAELTANFTQKIRQIEDQLRETGEQGREIERQIIKDIRSEVAFIKERFGLTVEFRIDTYFKEVTAYVCVKDDGRITKDGTAELTLNPYYDMLVALSSAITMGIGRYCGVKIPALTDYTAEQLSKEVGCDVKIIE